MLWGGDDRPALALVGPSLLEMLAKARLVEARIHGWTDYRTSSCTEGALVSARKL
jgi:hypothetical protein